MRASRLMGVHINHVTFDCGDARVLAAFWSTLTGWVTLADPEGNEFCLERGKAEQGPSTPRRFRLGE